MGDRNPRGRAPRHRETIYTEPRKEHVIMFHSFDASVPPDIAPAHCEAAIGYLGGDTEHVWTLEEWRRFSHLRQLGIWVMNTTGSPVVAARAACERAIALGWQPHGLTPRGIVLDVEAHVMPGWVTAFADELHSEGFACLPYGSADTITRNPAEQGRWVADWDQAASLGRVDAEIGHQYDHDVSFGGTTIDLSVWDSQAWHRFGYGPRR